MSDSFIVGIGVISPPAIFSITFTGTSTSLLDVSVKINFKVALPSPTFEVSTFSTISISLMSSGRFTTPDFNFFKVTSSSLLTSISLTSGMNFSDWKSLTLLAVKTISEFILNSLWLSIFLYPSYQSTSPS